MTVDVIAVSVLAIVTCFICVALRQYRPEFAICVGVSFGAIILLYLINRLSPVMSFLDGLAQNSGLSSAYFTPVLKGLGVSIAVGFAVDVCTDAGQTVLASKVEFAGKLAVLYLCLPFISDVITAIRELLT